MEFLKKEMRFLAADFFVATIFLIKFNLTFICWFFVNLINIIITTSICNHKNTFFIIIWITTNYITQTCFKKKKKKKLKITNEITILSN